MKRLVGMLLLGLVLIAIGTMLVADPLTYGATAVHAITLPGADALGSIAVMGMAFEQFKDNPQQQMRDYHEGDFQTTDPVTGEPRNEPLHDTSTPPIEQFNPANPAASKGTDYEASWNKDELQAEADRRGLTVKGSGEAGRVLKDDLIKALQKDDKAR